MLRVIRHRLIAGLALLLQVPLAGAVCAKDEIGHEEARRLLESGRILPLETILLTLSKKVPGKLLKSEFENEKGRLIYEFKVLRPEGRVQEVKVDATTGEFLKMEDGD